MSVNANKTFFSFFIFLGMQMSFSWFPENVLYGRSDLVPLIIFFFSKENVGMHNICVNNLWDLTQPTQAVLLCTEWVNRSLGRQMQQGCRTAAWVFKRFKLKHSRFSDLLYGFKYLRQQLDTKMSVRDFPKYAAIALMR